MITILTSTYNHAYALNRLYNSLCEQSNKRFEWLIIDDGSTDNTANLINGLKQDNKINIQYIYQQNQGKHVAINNGVNISSREWIFIVNSDAILAQDAVNTIINEINNYQEADIVGLCFRKADFNKVIVGNLVEDKLLKINPIEANYIFQGDLAYVFKRTALQSNPFPIIDNEKFIPKLLVWNKIADEGQILYFPQKVIYLTENNFTKKFLDKLSLNPHGFKLYYKDQLIREKSLKNKLVYFFRSLQCNYYIALNKKANK